MTLLPKHSSRVMVYTPWGTPGTPPLSRNETSDTAWEKALKRPGGLVNLHRDRDHNLDEDATKDFEATAAIRCAYEEIFFADGTVSSGQGNAIGDWQDATAGSVDNIVVMPMPFRTGGGLWRRSSIGPPVPWQIDAVNPFIIANTPFTIALYLYAVPPLTSPPGYTAVQIFSLTWDDWKFMLWNGQPRMMRFNYPPTTGTFNPSDYWNAADETTLQLLEQKDTKSDADYADIDRLRKQLFIDYSTLDLKINKKSWWESQIILTFIPEPRGILNIIVEGGGSAQIKHSAVAATRQPGTIWRTCAPNLATNYGELIWQFGWPLFSPGKFTGETYDYAPWSLTVGPEFNGLMDAETVSVLTGYRVSPNLVPAVIPGAPPVPSLPGTSIEISNDALIPAPATGNMKQITFALKPSADRRRTPLLWTLQAFIAAGTRTGYPRTLIWDSNGHPDLGGSPIKEVSPVHEDDQKTLCRRRGCDVTLRDVNGALALAATGYNALQGCLVDIYVDDYLVLGNGIIKEAEVLSVASAGGNTKMDTEVKLTTSDMWSIVEDDAMYDQPIGDGLPLNDYLVTIIQGSGAAPAEYGGIINNTGTPSDGPLLPQAAMGEKPAVQPQLRMKRADFLRQLVEKFGNGETLRCNGGAWAKGPKPTALGVDPVSGFFWQFSSLGAGNDPRSFPGRYQILEKSDLIRDPGDFYNYFRVVGANDTHGNPQVMFYPVFPSITASFKGTNIYLGHWKDYPDMHDSGLRTKADITKVLFTLAANHAQSFWYQNFQSYFHPALTVGTMIQADNVLGLVTRISGTSIADDRMTITYMQLRYV